MAMVQYIRDLPIAWQVFGTLTWRNVKGLVPNSARREKIYFRFIRTVCCVVGIKPRSSLWVRREERGEMFGRTHYHLLLNLGGGFRCTVSSCYWLASVWERCGGGPSTRFSVYDPLSDAAGYLCKARSEAASYELAKFGKSEVIVSDGVVEWLRRSGSEYRLASAVRR